MAIHGHQCIRRCGSTKTITGALLPSSHVLLDPSPGAGEPPNANAAVDARARLPREERGESPEGERERATSPAVSGNDAVSTTLRSLATHSPLSLWSSFSPFVPSFGSVAAKVGSSEERTSSVVGRFRRETRRQEEERREDPIVLGGSGGDDREGRLRKEGDSGDVCRAAAGTRGGTTPKGGMKE